MEQIVFSIGAALVSYIGIICGILQSIISPEEMKDGKRYFTTLIYILIGILSITQIINKEWITLLLTLFIAPIFYFDKIGFEYFFFGCILGLQPASFLYSASIIFIYGITEGSLLYKRKDKNIILIRSAIAFIAGLICTITISHFLF
jgi:hypothetical protein